MNDYAFGNKILELRTQLNLSQTELAEMVGVTNKATDDDSYKNASLAKI